MSEPWDNWTDNECAKELERLREAHRLSEAMIDALALKIEKEVCPSCKGHGHFLDSTYTRTGVDIECEKCFGTGKSRDQIRDIVQSK